MLGNASEDQLLPAAGRQLSREKENRPVVSLLLWGVFISSAVWSSLCAEGQQRRGPCAGARCTAQLHRGSHCLGSGRSSYQSFSPPPTAGVLPAPRIIGAGRADFQTSPQPSPCCDSCSIVIIHFQRLDCHVACRVKWGWEWGRAQPTFSRLPLPFPLCFKCH